MSLLDWEGRGVVCCLATVWTIERERVGARRVGGGGPDPSAGAIANGSRDALWASVKSRLEEGAEGRGLFSQ